jgi:hypothetical protein
MMGWTVPEGLQPVLLIVIFDMVYYHHHDLAWDSPCRG